VRRLEAMHCTKPASSERRDVLGLTRRHLEAFWEKGSTHDREMGTSLDPASAFISKAYFDRGFWLRAIGVAPWLTVRRAAPHRGSPEAELGFCGISVHLLCEPRYD